MFLLIVKYRYLILILFLAIFLRFYNLDRVPMGFSENEAAAGYNAYSILKTAQDEEGRFMPFVFRSFGDYKSPLPIYSTLPSVTLLGLNIVSVRMVPVFFGILSIVLFFLVACRLLKNTSVALLGSLLLTISPWHVQISRFHTGISLALFLFLVQMFLFFTNIGLAKKLVGLTFVQILLLLSHPSMWTLSLPLFFYWIINEVKFSGWQKIIRLTSLALVFLLLGILLKNNLKAFYLDQAFFKEVGFSNRINQLRGYSLDYTRNSLPGKLIQNKVIIFADQAFKNYLKGFDFYYLFSKNDNQDRFFVNAFGKFYSLELIFFILGVFFLIKDPSVSKKSLFLMLFLAPLPGIFNLKPNLGETLYLLIVPFYLITAFGFWKLLEKLKNKAAVSVVFILSLIIISVSAATFFHYYFSHYPIQSLKEWSYGYPQIAKKVEILSPQYERIIITDYFASKPYIYFLFFQSTNPKEYQEMTKDRGGSTFVSTTRYDKYEFRSLNWHDDQTLTKTLVVGSSVEIEETCPRKLSTCPQLIETIDFPDLENNFKIIGS